MPQTLYNLHTDGDQYRITKFVDGDVESSYLCTPTECECPAGHRPSCRHRQMLPDLIARKVCNTHWFWNFDRREVVDIAGNSKALMDNLNQLAIIDEVAPHQDKWYEPVGAAQHVEAAPILDLPAEHSAQSGDSIGRITASKVPWRRL